MNDEFTTQHDVQDGAVDEEQEAQTDEQFTFDPSAELEIGDVVIDLTQNAKMQVVDRAADSVRAFNEQEGFDLAEYKVHPQLRVSMDEPVFTCAYLKGELASPGGTYDFPQSRLARIPIEEANEDAMRPQDAIRLDLLAELFQTASRGDMPSSFEAVFDVVAHADVNDELVDAAHELFEAETFGES